MHPHDNCEVFFLSREIQRDPNEKEMKNGFVFNVQNLLLPIALFFSFIIFHLLYPSNMVRYDVFKIFGIAGFRIRQERCNKKKILE